MSTELAPLVEPKTDNRGLLWYSARLSFATQIFPKASTAMLVTGMEPRCDGGCNTDRPELTSVRLGMPSPIHKFPAWSMATAVSWVPLETASGLNPPQLRTVV